MENVKANLEAKRKKSKTHYDKRASETELPPLQVGQQVSVKTAVKGEPWKTGVITATPVNRSYIGYSWNTYYATQPKTCQGGACVTRLFQGRWRFQALGSLHQAHLRVLQTRLSGSQLILPSSRLWTIHQSCHQTLRHSCRSVLQTQARLCRL